MKSCPIYADLGEIDFVVVVEHSPPLQIIPDDGSKPTGFFPDLFYEVRDVLNFSITLKRSVDGAWGGLNEEDGSWSGMVGMVQR